MHTDIFHRIYSRLPFEQGESNNNIGGKEISLICADLCRFVSPETGDKAPLAGEQLGHPDLIKDKNALRLKLTGCRMYFYSGTKTFMKTWGKVCH